MGIGPEHKVLVPSIVDVCLTESFTSADPVPQSPDDGPADTKGLCALLSAIEHMKAGQMLKVWSSCVRQPPNNGICLVGSVVSYADLEIVSSTLIGICK